MSLYQLLQSADKSKTRQKVNLQQFDKQLVSVIYQGVEGTLSSTYQL